MPEFDPQQLQNSLFSQPTEKSFIDKLLGKEDVKTLRDLVKKKRLTREDLKEILNLLSSNEFKMLNYGEWDRYIMAKFFVWIREFVALLEGLYDYEDNIKKKKLVLTPDGMRIFDNIMVLMEHSVLFIVDLYLNLARTTLSLGGTGFLEMLKNKYEMQYTQDTTQRMSQDKTPLMRVKW